MSPQEICNFFRRWKGFQCPRCKVHWLRGEWAHAAFPGAPNRWLPNSELILPLLGASHWSFCLRILKVFSTWNAKSAERELRTKWQEKNWESIWHAQSEEWWSRAKGRYSKEDPETLEPHAGDWTRSLVLTRQVSLTLRPWQISGAGERRILQIWEVDLSSPQFTNPSKRSRINRKKDNSCYDLHNL